MARTLSLTALQSILAQETGEVWLICLKIDHSSFASPIKLVNDRQDLVRSDGTYQKFAFTASLPAENEQASPEASITIDNVDQSIIGLLRSADGDPPTVSMDIVLRSSPNTVEAGPFAFQLHSVTYDAGKITGKLGYESDFLNENFPGEFFNPNNAQGMF